MENCLWTNVKKKAGFQIKNIITKLIYLREWVKIKIRDCRFQLLNWKNRSEIVSWNIAQKDGKLERKGEIKGIGERVTGVWLMS